MKPRRPIQELGLSFLDVICCGFGAIILLLMITKVNLPEVLDESLPEVEAQVELQRLAVEEIIGDTDELNRNIVESEKDLERELERLRQLREQLLEIEQRLASVSRAIRDDEKQRISLAQAQQSLTDEMERLLGSTYLRGDRTIGGITVDSEYIIFVIDTSGSMQTVAWQAAVRKLEEVLDIHPVVKGIQVLNDMGTYMFPSFRGRWIQDTPARREAIVSSLRGWVSFSNSSPVEGLEAAIDTFYDPTKHISIYFFGDDFQGEFIEPVVDRIDQINAIGNENIRRVRIHAVGFPVYFDLGFITSNIYRFSNLMRELTTRNNGTFVGLPTVRDLQ